MPTKVPPTSPQRVGAWQCRDWCSFPLYINKKTWTSVLEAPGSLVALDVVLRHLVQLGLRSPSEQAQAMLAALCVLRDLRDDSSSSKQIPDAMKLRSIFLNVESSGPYIYVQSETGWRSDVASWTPSCTTCKSKGRASWTSLAGPFQTATRASQTQRRSLSWTLPTLPGRSLYARPTARWCRLTMTRQPGKALGALLDRAEGKGTTQQPQLALPAPPLPASKDVLPEKPPASADPPLPCPALCDRPSSQPLESVPTLEALPSKPSCAPEGLPTSQVQDEKVNDMAPHNRGISLAESVEKMKEARVKLKEGSNQSHGPVMKKPAKGPSKPQVQVFGQPGFQVCHAATKKAEARLWTGSHEETEHRKGCFQPQGQE